MATYTVRINGVDKALSNVLLENFLIREVTNGINTLTCDVESSDASYRPVKRQTIEVEEDDGTSPVRLIFGGIIKMVRERGFGQPADGIDDILMTVTADSYRQLAERRFVTETIPAGTLKQALQVLEPYLNIAPHFVTLDPAQVDGPTLDAIEFKVTRVDECLNFLAGLTAKYGAPFTWGIGYDKILGMYQTGTVAGPWNLVEGDGTETGDVEVEPTDDEYANKIYVVWGSGNVVDLGFDGLNTPEVFTGDGITNSFPLKYELVGPVPPPPLTSPPTASAIGYAFVNVPGGLIEFLGNTGTFGAEWEYDQVTNSVSRVAGAPPLGYVFSVPYRGLFTGEVTAEDAGEIAAVGLWEDKLLLPEIEDPVLAQSIADAELARRIATGRIVRFRTRRIPCVVPGETITITVPKRNISGSFTVTDVATDNEPGGATDDLSPSTENNLIRTVTCNLSIKEQEHQTLTRWWSEKDHAGIAQTAGSSAVPDWPLNSVQFNDEWKFGGAAHVLYGDLDVDAPDAFTSPPEVRTKGLHFVTNGGIGDGGHIGLDDPQRLEMGMLGSGDFSMDLFGDGSLDAPLQNPASILVNAPGNIFITAGTTTSGVSSPPTAFGAISLVGNQSIAALLLSGTPLPGIEPGISTRPGDVGDSYSRFNGLNVLEGVAGFYQPIASLPYTINTTSSSDEHEYLSFISTAGTGTINLPPLGDAGSPNFRTFPNTTVGRILCIVNGHASGTVTLDGDGGETINGDATITIGPLSAVWVQRYDTEWKILASHGTITGGGGGGTVTPGGDDKDVQFNDGGVLGGEDAFEYDKTLDRLQLTQSAGGTQLKVRTAASDAAMMGLISLSATAEITAGFEYGPAASRIARNALPGEFYWTDGGFIGAEVYVGETPGDPLLGTSARGFAVGPDGVFLVYQTGGLGTGNTTGAGVQVDRNSSGNGAASFLSIQTKSGTRHYIWVDDNDVPRIGSAPPQEDGTPSDTSGVPLGGDGNWIPLVDGSEPPNFITDGVGNLILVAGPPP